MTNLVTTDTTLQAYREQLKTLRAMKSECEKNMGSTCNTDVREKLEAEIKAVLKEIEKLNLKEDDEKRDIQAREKQESAVTCSLQEVADAMKAWVDAVILK